jgi:hypothetical protein
MGSKLINYPSSMLGGEILLSCLLEIMHMPRLRGMALCIISNHPIMLYDVNIFFTTLHIKLGFFHLMTLGLVDCICVQFVDLMKIHILWCSHGRECIISHYCLKHICFHGHKCKFSYFSLANTCCLHPCFNPCNDI